MGKRRRFTETTLWPDDWQDPWDMLDALEPSNWWSNRWAFQDDFKFEDRVYRVAEGFLAGPYPGAVDSDQQTSNLKWLLDQGVTTIISLMESGERDWKLRKISGYEKEVKALGRVACCRFPVRDLTAPTVKQTKRILNRIDQALSEGGTVYVHCLGGYGRTGAVAGCWLARHGYGTGEAALDQLDYLRRNEVTKCASPQTTQQYLRVTTWKKGK